MNDSHDVGDDITSKSATVETLKPELQEISIREGDKEKRPLNFRHPLDRSILDQWETFYGHASSLVETHLVKSNFPASVNIRGGVGKPTSFAIKALPSDDDLGLFLHRSRPLILQTEHASFVTITGLINKHIDESSV
jgi:hypothetical protein